MGVTVDQAGRNTGISQVDHLGVGRYLSLDLSHGTHGADAITVYDDGLVGPGRGAQSVKQPVGSDDQMGSCSIWHGIPGPLRGGRFDAKVHTWA